MMINYKRDGKGHL